VELFISDYFCKTKPNSRGKFHISNDELKLTGYGNIEFKDMLGLIAQPIPAPSVKGKGRD